tara:strand:- start:1052 stop:2011 length:960 start_codon:yes stop_codon:yes gene_type:complete
MSGQGDLMYGSAANTPARLAKDANATRSLTNTGTSNNPAWAQVALATGVSGTLPVANGGTNLTSLGSGVATFMGTPSSANLRGALTDETGTGSAVFATSPTLVTPALGTPGSGVLTSCTGLPEAGLAVSNAPTNGYMLTAQSGDAGGMTWAAASGGGAVTREGGNTSEGTTTSTSVVDLLTSSSLTVLVTEPFYYTWNGRKTTGASAWFSHGIKLNSTTITDAATLGIFYSSGDADEVQDGGARVWFGPRVTNYFTNVNGQFSTFDASQVAHNVLVSKQNLAAVIPNATVTDVIVTAKVNNASITTGADEAQIYSEAAS